MAAIRQAAVDKYERADLPLDFGRWLPRGVVLPDTYVEARKLYEQQKRDAGAWDGGGGRECGRGCTALLAWPHPPPPIPPSATTLPAPATLPAPTSQRARRSSR